jgi:hypothetical protein
MASQFFALVRISIIVVLVFIVLGWFGIFNSATKNQGTVSNQSFSVENKSKIQPNNTAIIKYQDDENNIRSAIDTPNTFAKRAEAKSTESSNIAKTKKESIQPVNNATANQNDMGMISNNSATHTPANTKQTFEIISIKDVPSKIGNKVQITERISQVTYAANGNVYLNIGGRYPSQKLSLVIFKKNVDNFGNLRKHESKVLKVKGTLSNYKGKTQIIINQNWQLQEA